MSIIKTVFVAASLVLAAASANAAGRMDLESGFHGNTQTYQSVNINAAARGAFAQAGTTRRSARMNPLNDMFHGLAVR